ncbi:response regulator [Cryobacterium sp. MDB2-33-2]|uniref:winged helix-turn-helix transcriptional regulator n=1 Tax=Cryobacterium sp. MDB2-33-2 TaxID=1259179 RepID=UPI00106D87BC|nr:response regulator [Cryobacterium sp. MDB2-33-2]
METTESERRVAVIIEDDDDIRHLLEAVLTQAGFDAIATSNGVDGVRAVRAYDPIVTTLDVSMPGMDGLETAKRIRAFSSTYIVMLTARDEEIDTLQGLEAGADDYMTKPFRPRELRARIDAMMRRPRQALVSPSSTYADAPSADASDDSGFPAAPAEYATSEHATTDYAQAASAPEYAQAPPVEYRPAAAAPHYQQPPVAQPTTYQQAPQQPQAPQYQQAPPAQYQQAPPQQAAPPVQYQQAPPPGYVPGPSGWVPAPVEYAPASPQGWAPAPTPEAPPVAQPQASAPSNALALIAPQPAVPDAADWMEHNGLRLSPEMRLAVLGTAELDLTRTEFDLLAALLDSKRRVRSKADLALLLRGESYVTAYYVNEADKRAVEAHMGNLRRKLGDSLTTPRWLETVRGVGYRLAASEDD